MDSTPASLLDRLRLPADPNAWNRFVELYTPFIYYWARRVGLSPDDAADLVQDVFTLLVQKLPEFQLDSQRSFRAWLRTVTLNKWRENQRRRAKSPPAAGDGYLADLPAPAESDAFWETEYREHLVGSALEVMQAEFQPATWKACWEFVVNGRPAAEVAAELHISVNAVYLAKSHILRRLRQELAGMLE